MRISVDLSKENLRSKTGGPFGAIVVKDGRIVGRGTNRVTSDKDPTAHAEIVAIRDACRSLENFNLAGCAIYTSCEPCPMCLSAIYWARIGTIYYANTQQDAADIDFDDAFLYAEVALPKEERSIPLVHMLRAEALEAFEEWKQMEDRIPY